MHVDDAVRKLRIADPAQKLSPLSTAIREQLCEATIASEPAGIEPMKLRPLRARRYRHVIVIAVIALGLGVGAAWAAGVVTPLSVFQHSLQQQDATTGSLWDQHVIPSSVVAAAEVVIPQVGAVRFFYGRSDEGGWCGALRLPSNEWVGTGRDSHDAGGTVPGCFPTREAVNSAGTPVYVINGFDYQEGLVDARPDGGSLWRIRYGFVSLPAAVRVADTVSGRAAPVTKGGLFMLAVPDAHSEAATSFHLVAYDDAGKIVGQD
jgi:hypothetical protein